MGIRLPLQVVKVLDDSGNVGATSVAGGTAYNFFVPQDTDNITVKFTASVSGGGVSALVQTTDDGGTTWYDVARTSVVSNANNTTAEWLDLGVTGVAPRSQKIFGGSILSGTIGSAAASTLGQSQYSGMPILGTLNRVFFIMTAAVSACSLVQGQIKVNSQTPSA